MAVRLAAPKDNSDHELVSQIDFSWQVRRFLSSLVPSVVCTAFFHVSVLAPLSAEHRLEPAGTGKPVGSKYCAYLAPQVCSESRDDK